MASATGSGVIDFGAFPGSNEASVAIIGQGAIGAGSKCDAFVMADDTSTDHTALDHRYFERFASLSCGNATAGVGFTVYATSEHKMQGKWAFRWVWAD